jgi:hypothetical protein
MEMAAVFGCPQLDELDADSIATSEGMASLFHT